MYFNYSKIQFQEYLKMKIIICNKFYYNRGGDCTYTLNLEQLLKSHGHQVAIFAMDYPNNFATEWKKYFPSNMTKFKAFTRPFGSKEVIDKFTQLINDFKPDIIHLNNIHTQLSPVIGEIASQKGIKVIWTIHDYKLLCPRYDCLRNNKIICELCFSGSKSFCKKYKCIKGSIIGSYIGYYEATTWHKERLENNTTKFICPSHFMTQKMIDGNFNPEKIKTICNFINVDKCKQDDFSKKDYCCYIGRLSNEKGIKTLINAMNQLPYKLIIIGTGPLEKELKSIAKSNIEFVGFKNWDEIKSIVSLAKFSIIPSEWYENNPLSVIESLSIGTPVLGANIGGIPELITEYISGLTFESKNINDLKEKITEMFKINFDYKAIAETSQKRFNAEVYYNELIQIYCS